MADEKDTIREMYRKYWSCMISKDVDGLRDLMADDYYLLHMTGVKQSAKVFLNGLLDSTFNYYSADHDSIEVSPNGDHAIMTGRSRVMAAVYGGAPRAYLRRRSIPEIRERLQPFLRCSGCRGCLRFRAVSAAVRARVHGEHSFGEASPPCGLHRLRPIRLSQNIQENACGFCTYDRCIVQHDCLWKYRK